MSDYTFHQIRSTSGLFYNSYEVTRKGEREPFAIVTQTRKGGWDSYASWTAKSIADESLTHAGQTRADAVKGLVFYKLTPEDERERIQAAQNAEYEAEREAAIAAARERELAALRSPVHQHQALIEAYHVLFDIKDDGDPSRIADTKARSAWEAIRALIVAMNEAGIEVPRRFDGDGRP